MKMVYFMPTYFKIVKELIFLFRVFITSDLNFVILELKRWKRNKKPFNRLDKLIV